MRNKTPVDIKGAPQETYILESSDFRIWAETQRTNAERLIEDLDTEIVRLNAEVEARQQRRADLLEIVMRADAALVLDLTATRVAPQLTPHGEGSSGDQESSP